MKIFIASMDVRYDVDLAYKTEYSCADSGCDSGGICRCGRICNPEIRSVNSWVIAKHFADAGYPIQFFAIERFCSRLGTEDFDISWSGGYYGDEIDYVRLGDAAKQQIMHIKNLRGVDLVEFALKNEYSNVLPQYKNRQWEFTQNALVDNLILGVPNRRDINKDRVNFYKSHIGGKSDQYNPVLLCELHEQIYKVIDGYHRYTALKELGIKKVDIIYFERDGNKSQGEFELGGAL